MMLMYLDRCPLPQQIAIIQQLISKIPNKRQTESSLYFHVFTLLVRRARETSMIFFRHENQPYPPSLCQAGKLQTGTKSDILQCFEEMISPTTQAPEVTCVILDGAAIVQMLHPGTAKTFGKYAKEVFIPFVLSQYKSTTQLDLVWDQYLPGTLKSMT